MGQHKKQARWFNNANGYGFLGWKGVNDVFCHFAAVEGNVHQALGQRELVQRATFQGDKGPQAAGIKRSRKS